MTEHKEKCSKKTVKNPAEPSSSFSFSPLFWDQPQDSRHVRQELYHRPAWEHISKSRLLTWEEDMVERKVYRQWNIKMSSLPSLEVHAYNPNTAEAEAGWWIEAREGDLISKEEWRYKHSSEVYFPMWVCSWVWEAVTCPSWVSPGTGKWTST